MSKRVSFAGIFLCIAELIIPHHALGAEAERRLPQVVSISGTGTASLKWGSKEISLKSGQRFPFGSVLTTGNESSVVMLFPDSSKLIVFAESEVKVEEWTGSLQAARLHFGRIRASVPPARIPEKGKGPLRFLVRTKAAVLGVRGTEFVMDYDSVLESLKVHTLSGSVEVARDEDELFVDQGIRVDAGQGLEASSKGIGTPISFDPKELAAALHPTAARKRPEQLSIAEPAPKKPEESRSAPGPADQVKELPQDTEVADFRETQLKRLGLSTQITGNPAGLVSWDPVFPLFGAFSFRAHLGAGGASHSTESSVTWIHEEQAFLRFSLLGTPVFAEGGYGLRNWPALSLNERVSVVKLGLNAIGRTPGFGVTEVAIGHSQGNILFGFGLGF